MPADPAGPATLRAAPSAFARFWRNPAVRASVGILLLVIAAAAFGPVVLPTRYQVPTTLQLAPPSLAHWLGTDLNGRDQLYRVFIGARISL